MASLTFCVGVHAVCQLPIGFSDPFLTFSKVRPRIKSNKSRVRCLLASELGFTRLVWRRAELKDIIRRLHSTTRKNSSPGVIRRECTRAGF
jgi:hypothetical protein